MYPGPNDTDWQVARFQHREMVAMGLHQQFAASALASALAPRVDRGHGPSTIRPRFATALMQASRLLLGGNVATGDGSRRATSIERGATV